MCGITGFCDFNKKSSKETLINMTNQIDYRGPDSSGYFIDEKSTYQLGLGHRRLSILDLSSLGAQPMTLGNLQIVLNGEIYNFEEIRKELVTYGYTFVSQSDTEVVLAAFHKWGIGSLSRFIGMFAFAIYDSEKQELYIVRDRAGVKPLYYSFVNNTFLFASELKSIVTHCSFKKHLCNDAILQYFTSGYIPQPLTIYQNTFKLRAGHYLKLDLRTQKSEEIKYWNVLDFYNKPKLTLSEDEVLAEVERLLLSACRYRMIADVPVGVFLSGGYDSTAVAALIQSGQVNKLNTYTIGFAEKKYDEAPYAKLIANYIGTNHHEYYCTSNDAKDILPKLATIFDEPFGDSSAIPTYLVSANARKEVTVALSADGGDEIFGGYNSYTTAMKYISRFESFSPAVKKLFHASLKGTSELIVATLMRNNYNADTRLQKIVELLTKDKSVEDTFRVITSINTPTQTEKLLLHSTSHKNSSFSFSNELNGFNTVLDNLMAIDYRSYMVDDVLTKVDRASMAVSLEGREPLLDHRIIEFMAQVPSSMKIKNGEKKYLLKKLTHKYVPQELLDRPKKGFGFPVFEWLRGEMTEYVNEYLSEHKVKQQGILNYNEIKNLVTQYQKGSQVNAQKIWLLLNFQMWYDRWID
jgi:asparagine synthase (glutamine-hydrolysing)